MLDENISSVATLYRVHQKRKLTFYNMWRYSKGEDLKARSSHPILVWKAFDKPPRDKGFAEDQVDIHGQQMAFDDVGGLHSL